MENRCGHEVASDIHYGLMTLIELAEVYGSEGCPISYIAHKHDFCIERLYSIVERLEVLGLVKRRLNNPEWLLLREAPGDRWILEIVSVLRKAFLC